MSGVSVATWLEHYQLHPHQGNQPVHHHPNPLESYHLAVPHYAYAEIVGRILERVRASGKPLKEIHGAVGISKDQWSRKQNVQVGGMRGKGSTFTYEELSRIATYFGADPGWPFIDWDLASANRRAADALKSLGESARPLSTPTPRAAGDGGPRKTTRSR